MKHLREALFLFVSISILHVAFPQGPVTSWEYIQLDSMKPKWGDYSEPAWLRYFGVDMGDLNNDGLLDVVSGRTAYLNPGDDMSASWEKVDLGMNVDGILIMDVDGDDRADIIGQALPDLYWLESVDKVGTRWTALKVAEIPRTSHVNSQGFAKGQLMSGGREEILIAGNGNVYMIEIPNRPQKDDWPTTLIGENTSDEGIGVGDLDGDGDLDIAAGRRPKGAEEPSILVWFENPGPSNGSWIATEVGKSNHPIDRVGIADLNADGRGDIVVCEERWPGKEPDGNIFWYEQPAEGDQWTRHHVVTQYSINNLDLEDIDDDGDVDLITGEHKGPNLELQLWANDGSGFFEKQLIDRGKESHLGTQVADLDGDGDLDVVSIGWDRYQYVHLWRNDRVDNTQPRWRLVSSENGDIEVPNTGNQQTASLIADVDGDGDQDFFISERTTAPSLTMYRYDQGQWLRHVIDADPLFIEAGSAAHDIDGDGDLDVVFGGESRSNEVWWWENPAPNFDPAVPWKRYHIKKSGANKHHDQLFGDFDNDGREELVFWNQGGRRLVLAEIPEEPKRAEEWPMRSIYTYSSDSEMEPAVGLGGYPGWSSTNEHEGLAKTDVDGDGNLDIVGGGRWFKYEEGAFTENLIDASYTFSRSAVGQFIEGGRPEVLLVVGDGVGPLFMYEWIERKDNTGSWKKTKLLDQIDNGHTIDVLDFNGDGHEDIFSAEMRFGEGNPDSKVRVLLGDGRGDFKEVIIAKGYGVHEGRMADLDGDGDYDVLGKPYTWKAPLLNIWINEGQ